MNHDVHLKQILSEKTESFASEDDDTNTILNHDFFKYGLEDKVQYMFDVSMGDLEKYMAIPLPSMKALDMNVHLKCFIHELRTPISTISSGLELLTKSTPSPEQTAEIISDSVQTIQFIEDILTKFAVIQDDDPVLNAFEPFLFSTLFGEIHRLMRYQIDDTRDLNFTTGIEPSIMHRWYLGDKHNIEHVIINLIKNAIKYRDKTCKNTISLDVTLSRRGTEGVSESTKNVSDAGVTVFPHPPNSSPTSTKHFFRKQHHVFDAPQERLMLSVCDTNPHLGPDIKKNLFQMFNSTSGSGLGLYICKNIVELHGGTIYHDFLEHQGNKFTIQLDLDTVHQTSTVDLLKMEEESVKIRGNALKPTTILSTITRSFSETERCQDWLLPKQTKHTYNVLIVDDSTLNRKLMYKLLKRMEIFNDVFTAEHGKDAVQKVEMYGNNIDVILMDKSMPIMDGFQAVTHIRKVSHYTGLIVGLTGYDDHATISEFIQCGANHVMVKPLNKKHLVEYILHFYTTKRAHSCLE